MLKLTETAVKEVKHIISGQDLEGKKELFLRLGVAGGGCSGFKFTLDLTESYNQDADELFEQDEVKIICDPKSYIYLEGTTLDFKDEIMGRGFVFDCPQATHKCGCGSSASF